MKTINNLSEKISDFNQNQNQIETIKNNLIFAKIKLIKKELDITKKLDIKRHRVSEVQQINSFLSWFFIEKKHYFILRSLVTKYGKDNVINIVNNIVINNVKEDE